MNRRERRARAKAEFEAQKPSHRLGDAPVEEEHQEQMIAIMRTLDEFLNGDAKGDARRTGIVIMLFAPRGLWGLFAERTGIQLFPVRRRLTGGPLPLAKKGGPHG